VTYSLVLIYAEKGAWRKFKLPPFVMLLGRKLFEFPEEAPDACDVQVSSPGHLQPHDSCLIWLVVLGRCRHAQRRSRPAALARRRWQSASPSAMWTPMGTTTASTPTGRDCATSGPGTTLCERNAAVVCACECVNVPDCVALIHARVHTSSHKSSSSTSPSALSSPKPSSASGSSAPSASCPSSMALTPSASASGSVPPSSEPSS
jgi:hypothetical protein